jgi:hypothetical protein
MDQIYQEGLYTVRKKCYQDITALKQAKAANLQITALQKFEMQ